MTEKKAPHNKPELKPYRRKLRQKMTPAEARLWTYLKNRQIDGRRFRRQFSIGPYILDFYCPEENLSVELDGESHAGPIAAAKDAERSAYLRAQGINELRFENRVVFEMPEALIERVKQCFKRE
ncbi:endonuclease domain-containing protein [Coraliomargarita parva]|uniref:endonuclease domain-containing protein n=1 Tax=Coraliomargarita parva TaxID=3014050 RepID=UPI0022B5632F|nr:endonuclease domain-containing protein [Coraliomargarita parva]